MTELMLDVFRSLHRARFREVYCVRHAIVISHSAAS